MLFSSVIQGGSSHPFSVITYMYKDGPSYQMMCSVHQYLQQQKKDKKILVCEIYPQHHVYTHIQRNSVNSKRKNSCQSMPDNGGWADSPTDINKPQSSLHTLKYIMPPLPLKAATTPLRAHPAEGPHTIYTSDTTPPSNSSTFIFHTPTTKTLKFNDCKHILIKCELL